MTTYSYAQLEGLWVGAGGDPGKAPLMAAIALAESGGNSTARNPSGATGLWQILVPVHGDLISRYGDPTDPQANAKEAVSIEKSQGLGAWTTYTSGAYQRYLKSGVAPEGVTGTATAATASATSGQSCCAIGFGGVNVPLAGSTGGFCLLSKTQVNSIVGFFILSGGVLIGVVGVGWMLAYGLKKSGADRAIVQALLPEAKAGGTAMKIISGAVASNRVNQVSPGRATGSGKANKAARERSGVKETKSEPLRI